MLAQVPGLSLFLVASKRTSLFLAIIHSGLPESAFANCIRQDCVRATFNSGKTVDGVFDFHPFYKACDTLEISVAAANRHCGCGFDLSRSNWISLEQTPVGLYFMIIPPFLIPFRDRG